MLSPKQTNVVAPSRGGAGGGTTVTEKLQESWRSCASVVWQLTEVEPIGKLDAAAGLHFDVSGAVPPEAVGAG
jgi:hypothetical protein